MASSSYSELCRQTKRELTQGFERRETTHKFATRVMVKDVMSKNKLQRVYESLRPEDDSTNTDSNFDAQEFIRLIEVKKLHHFLAVLMYAQCSVNAAKAFVETLVRGTEIQEWPKENPYLLPATEEYLNNLFGDPNDASAFFHDQRPFCAIVVGGPGIVKMRNEDQRTLPWSSEKNIGEGSFGVVFKVKVAEGHLTKDRDFNQINVGPVVIARKDFITDSAEEDFEKEWKAISDIFNSTRTHDNIVESFGTIKIEGQPSTFSLLMPLADMDLDKYMKLHKDVAINDRIARQNLIQAAMGLTDGLHFLHDGLKKEDGGASLICYHMDLKPNNILVFIDGPYMKWKLSDFGLSRVKQKTRPEVSDLSNIFRKRGSDQHSKATGTANRRRDGTYLPPEAQDKDRTMNEKSDIWSLGCIISLIFTFMEKGLEGIDPYSESRYRHSNTQTDVFYQRNKTNPIYSTNKGVAEQHNKLIESAQKRNPKEGDSFFFMLKWLENKVLVIKQDQRCNAEAIHQRLKGTLEKYKNMENPPPPLAPPRSQSFASRIMQKTGSTLSGLRRASSAHPSKKTGTQTDISQWRLKIEKGMRFDGYDSAPDGKFLIYWNSQDMKLFSDSVVTLNSVSSFQSGNASTYSSGSSSRPKNQFLTSLGQHILPRTKQSWRCGVVNERYLIAATTDGTFKCYIFDIESDNTLATYSQVTLANIDCGIHKLIAPCDTSSFACILHDDRRGQCSILIAKIAVNSSPQSNGQTGSSRSLLESNHRDAGISLLQQRTCPLECSANEIKHVVLRTRNEVYVAVQHRYNLSLYLFTIEPPGALRQDLNLQAGGDNGERLFTDMICFPNIDDSSKTDVILVAQRETIFHFTFDGPDNDPKKVRHLPVKLYWILKVARSESGSIVALGRHSGYGSSYVVLLSVKLKGVGIRPELTKLAELDGVSEAHNPKFTLLEGGNGSVAQVTTTTPDGQYRVYRLDLSGLLDT